MALGASALVLGISVWAGAWSASSAFASPASGSTVQGAANAKFGEILVDVQGLALYTYAKDHGGISTCTGACAQAWPPLTVPAGTTPTAGAGVPGALAASLQADGSYQVTYNGDPLYTFVGDATPGQVTGNGVAGFSVVTLPTSVPSSTTTPSTMPAAPAPTTTPTVTAPPTPLSTAPAAPSARAASAPPSASTVPSEQAGTLAMTGPGVALLWTVAGGTLMIAIGGGLLARWGSRRRASSRRAKRLHEAAP